MLVFGERQTWLLEPTTPVPTYRPRRDDWSRLSPVRRRLNERLQAVVDAVVRLLRLEAEVRTTEEREDAARARPQGEEGPGLTERDDAER